MNTRSPLFKYQIGLLVIGVLTAILVIFLLVQAHSSRQDTKTHTAAIEIAEKINYYVTEEGKVPESLDDVDASSVPATISYEKLSSEKYRFCVTYKSDSSNLNATSAINQALVGAYNYDEYTTDSYLYLSNSYKKGENCQSIEPYIYSQSFELDENETSGSAGPYTTCGEDHNYSWTSLQVTAISAGSVTVYSTPASTFDVDTNVKVFDRDCNPISYNELQLGDTIGLYFNPYGSPVTMIVKEY